MTPGSCRVCLIAVDLTAGGPCDRDDLACALYLECLVIGSDCDDLPGVDHADVDAPGGDLMTAPRRCQTCTSSSAVEGALRASRRDTHRAPLTNIFVESTSRLTR